MKIKSQRVRNLNPTLRERLITVREQEVEDKLKERLKNNRNWK